MEKQFYSIYNKVKQTWCNDCDSEQCQDCVVSEILNDIKRLDPQEVVEEQSEGCLVCRKRDKNKDIFYDTGRGGFQISNYCPNCGRKI